MASSSSSSSLPAFVPTGRRDPLPKFEVRHIELPRPYKGRYAVVIDNVYTPEECAALIRQTEARGYCHALINVGGGHEVYLPEVRNNDRCMVDSFEEAEELFRRIKDFIPASQVIGSGKYGEKYDLLAINERMRYLRYVKGQKFEPHLDGSFGRAGGTERSFVTVQLYLNEDMKGGSTRFLPADEDSGDFTDVNPKTGSVLIFQHNIMHQGSEVTEGIKYVVRTDVMYKRHQSAPFKDFVDTDELETVEADQ